MLKLNETPRRTSRNFNINNIKLENVEISEKIKEFNNVQIIGNNSKLNIDSNTKKTELAYGLGEFFETQVNKNSNADINIVVDSKTSSESQILFKFDKDNLNLVDDIQINANENTKSTIIIKYESEKDVHAYHNGLIKVVTKKEAEVNIIVVNLLNDISNNLLAIENTLDEGSKVKYTIVDFGGKNSITNYYSNQIGNNSENLLNTIYIGKDEQRFDLNYIAELRGEKTSINIDVQGALKDKSNKNFKGTIDFKKGTKKSSGFENENCMLLSDTAKSIALPMLLCSEEDVEGEHSSSAGKIGEKELFYIMSRGFEKKEAMKLLVRANFNKIIETIKNKELKEQIINEINHRLD